VAGALAGGPVGAAAGFLGGIAKKAVVDRSKSLIGVYADKAAGLLAVERARNAVDGKLRSAINGMLTVGSVTTDRAPALTAMEATQDAQDRFKAHVKALTEFVSNPDKAVDQLSKSTGGIDNGAPLVAQQLRDKSNQAAQFLLSKMPKRPVDASLKPNDDWAPSTTEIKKFNKYVDAVNNPLKVLDQAKHGIVSQEGIEVLKTLMPKLHQQLVTSVLDKVQRTKDLPYSKRLMLGQVLGIPTDNSLTQSSIAALQQAKQPIKSNTPPAPQGASTNLAANAETPTDKFQR
jgi:hypothetical protein